MRGGGVWIAVLLLVSFILLFGCTQGQTPAQPQPQPEQQTPPITSNQTNQTTTPAPAPAKVIGGEPSTSTGSQLVDVSSFPEKNENQKVIKKAIGAYKGGDTSSFSGVNEIANLGPGATDDIIWLLQFDNIYAQWSAVYAISELIPQANGAQKEKMRTALLPLLSSRWASIRAASAYDLVALGEKSAIPVLIDSLGQTDKQFLSETPTPICETANEALTAYTEKDFGFSCSLTGFDSKGKSDWQGWWASKGKALNYDSAKKKFIEG